METEVMRPPTLAEHHERVARALETIDDACQAFLQGRIAYGYTLDRIIARELASSREHAEALGRLTLAELQHVGPMTAERLTRAYVRWQEAFRGSL